MAIKKVIEAENTGVTIEYHKISSLSVRTDLAADMWVSSYATKELRLAGKDEVSKEQYFIPAGSFTQANLDGLEIMAFSYNWLKSQPKFTGCIDD